MTTGYSDTPLSRKLSLREGMRTWWERMPATVREEIELDGLELDLLSEPEPPIEAAHIFVTSRAEMERDLKQLRPLLAPNGFIWVSWPKRSSGIDTDIDGNVIRGAVLTSTDLVDVKICAVDAVWSGLKLMIRRSHR